MWQSLWGNNYIKKMQQNKAQFKEVHAQGQGWKKEKLTKGLSERWEETQGNGGPGKQGAKKMSAELEVTWQRSAETSGKASLVEGGTGNLCQWLAVSGNCQTPDHDSI